MTIIAQRAVLLSNMVLEIEGDDFAAAVSKARLEPDSQIVRFKGLKKGAVASFPSDAAWSVSLIFADDWEGLDSLSQYLWDHAGEKKNAYLRPVDGVGAAFEMTLALTTGGAGGDADQVATSTITIGVDGTPTRIPAAAAAPTLRAITPAAGDDGGGELVKIRGRGFNGTTDVDFGANPATTFTVDSDSTITALTPAGSAGTVLVVVTNATGASTGYPFTYEA